MEFNNSNNYNNNNNMVQSNGGANGPVVLENVSANILNRLNKLGNVKPWIKVAELEIGKAYRILGARQLPSKFDQTKTKTIIELENGYLSLPSRFDDMDQETFEWIRLKPNLAIVNNGGVGKSFKLEFIPLNIMDYYNSLQNIVN